MNEIIVKLDAFYVEVLERRPHYGLCVSYRDIAKGYECYAEALSCLGRAKTMLREAEKYLGLKPTCLG